LSCVQDFSSDLGVHNAVLVPFLLNTFCNGREILGKWESYYFFKSLFCIRVLLSVDSAGLRHGSNWLCE